jgi:pyruvate dehydrogenase E2 component (dihydrolipoamide acetyltransferase)
MFEYELPDVGEGVAEGEIVAWHVEPGDHVSEDEVLADVETDKAVVDLPAPVDGVVQELHADPGDTAAVGSVVVTIDTDANAGSTNESGASDAGSTDESGAPDTGSTDESGASDTGDTGTAGADSVAEASADGPDQNGTDASEVSTSEERVFAPPNVRRLARELDVTIETVEGSGPSGRVTEGDVRAAAESDDEPEPAVTPTESAITDDTAPTENGQRTSAVSRRDPAEPTDGATPADRDRTLAVPATRGVARELNVDLDEVPTDKTRDGKPFVEPDDVRAYAKAQQAAQAADAATVADAGATTATTNTADTGTTAADTAATVGTETDRGEAVTREPYQGVRQTIGEAMAESAYTAPHASHHDMAPAEGLADARQRLKPRAEEAGVHLTYMPFVMKAVAAVLPEYPAMNAQLDEESEEILYHNRYNIGVAVATDAGLMVPVVDDVDRKGLLDIAAEVNDLVERARNRELAPEEFQGSTFTITNFGAIGGEYATPILNYPETGILGLGELQQRPVVEDGEVVAQHTLPLSVSIDHRVVDGAVSAGFCNDLKTYLDDPIHLLL